MNIRTKRVRAGCSRRLFTKDDSWRIVNLEDNLLEIRRSPKRDETQAFGHGYAAPATLSPDDVAVPLAVPSASVPVADLLPA